MLKSLGDYLVKQRINQRKEFTMLEGANCVHGMDADGVPLVELHQHETQKYRYPSIYESARGIIISDSDLYEATTSHLMFDKYRI